MMWARAYPCKSFRSAAWSGAVVMRRGGFACGIPAGPVSGADDLVTVCPWCGARGLALWVHVLLSRGPRDTDTWWSEAPDAVRERAKSSRSRRGECETYSPPVPVTARWRPSRRGLRFAFYRWDGVAVDPKLLHDVIWEDGA